jgi:hypothetical protein
VARAVYTKCFLATKYPALSGSFIVPAGDTAVLHHMTLWVRDDHPASTGTLLTVALDDAGMFVWDVKASTTVSGIYQWTGGEVFTTALYLAFLGPYAYAFRANGQLLTPT